MTKSTDTSVTHMHHPNLQHVYRYVHGCKQHLLAIRFCKQITSIG